MRIVHVDQIIETVAKLCWASYYLPEDVLAGFKRAENTELHQSGRPFFNSF